MKKYLREYLIISAVFVVLTLNAQAAPIHQEIMD